MEPRSSTQTVRVRMDLRGVVQGVGFRPFVYRTARAYRLAGEVFNHSAGVTIFVEGPRETIDRFRTDLLATAPPGARIDDFRTRDEEPVGADGFRIVSSRETGSRTEVIPPELATCDDCLREMSDPSDRRFGYPFINCTNCGPRFTIVKDIPYDREATTMSAFRMCPECAREYGDPEDRRFHAEPNACPVCGPRVWLEDSVGNMLAERADAVSRAVKALRDGKTVAIKGLGGFHLASDARNPEAVEVLRRRKQRHRKPFAVMMPDTAAVERECVLSRRERELLESVERPIVLLRRREGSSIVPGVAPGLDEIGVMLPYTPLHHLILREFGSALVMTSANISEEPIAYRNEESGSRLAPLADLFLLHDREIHMRCDDSVARVDSEGPVVLRRSRGYVPRTLELPCTASEGILACGAHLKNTFCLVREDRALLSHHIGDLENLEAFRSFEEGIVHFRRLFQAEPKVIVSDLHPEYYSTRYAREAPFEHRVGVQHHYAHLAACLAQNGSAGPAIGVCFDGTGYGEDGRIWGGEFLVGNLDGYLRAGHLEYMPLPGGDAAVRNPWQTALGYLWKTYDGAWRDRVPAALSWDGRGVATVEGMLRHGINVPETSSMGRLFDAVAALVLGIREITYEGEAAILLEMAARRHARKRGIAPPFTEGRPYRPVRGGIDGGRVPVVPVVRAVVDDLGSGTRPDEAAYRFHRTVAEIVLVECRRLRAAGGLNCVALSGGTFQNLVLLEQCRALLSSHGFTVLTHDRVPPNDGGIAFGQAAVAAYRFRTRDKRYVSRHTCKSPRNRRA